MDVSSNGSESFRDGMEHFFRKLLYFVCIIPLLVGEGLDKKIIQSINPDDYDYAVAIIIGSKKKPYGKDSKNDIDILIKKIREKLEDSPVAILPFIESCTRNAHLNILATRSADLS